eukprot:8584752-Alexandrium_andersonii.AAC.1
MVVSLIFCAPCRGMGLGNGEIERCALCNLTWGWMRAVDCQCMVGVQHGGRTGLYAETSSDQKCRCTSGGVALPRMARDAWARTAGLV